MSFAVGPSARSDQVKLAAPICDWRSSASTEDQGSRPRVAQTRVSPSPGPGVTSARPSPPTIGPKYRVSFKAGRASPSPANFESGCLARLRLRPELRGFRASATSFGVATDSRMTSALQAALSKNAVRNLPGPAASIKRVLRIRSPEVRRAACAA